MVVISAEPPNDTNGSGMPVTGSSPTTAPMLITACAITHTVTPAASSEPNRSGAGIAMRTPSTANTANRPSTRKHPIRPSSSPMMAKMKSVCALGRKFHFERLAPSPTPVKPPLPSAINDCTIW